jgi:hypothetical protein
LKYIDHRDQRAVTSSARRTYDAFHITPILQV